MIVTRLVYRAVYSRCLFRSLSKCNMSSEGKSVHQDISQVRKPYSNGLFTEEQLVSGDPIEQFTKWYEEAAQHDGILEANAMTLATADGDGKPSARMVLLKGFGQEGFKFFTNFSSRKARDIASNPQAALVFYWTPFHRSVRVEGSVEKLSEDESGKYFATRPKCSQIAAHVSKCQSSPVDSREALVAVGERIQEKFNGSNVPKPDFWGGYLVRPHTIEFWQGQSTRMHDRIQFLKKRSQEIPPGKSYLKQGKNGWIYQRLFP